MIAVADQGLPPSLNIYRLSDQKNLFHFTPENCSCEKFTSLFFHCDSERISALLGPPENLIYTFNLVYRTVEAVTYALHKNINTEITQVI